MFLHDYFIKQVIEDQKRKVSHVSHYDLQRNLKQRSGLFQKIKNLIHNRNISGSLICHPQQTCCEC
jgi:hypothetical protein